MFTKLIRFTVAAVALAGCTADQNPEIDDEPTDDELAAGLAQGKADGYSGPALATASRLHLFGAAARQLYGLMDEAGATAQTGGGYRLLRGTRTACISDGLATYCELAGSTDVDLGEGYETGIRGNRVGSAASYLLELLRAKAQSTGADVSVPWFRCIRGSRVRCGVEEHRDLVLEFAKLPPLADGFVYEGWAIENGATTTDRFTSAATVHQMVPLSLADATAYVLTIEPRRGDLPGASDTHIVAGPIENGTGMLTTDHPAALGTGFAAAAARYVLATPSSPEPDDGDQGIWFVDPSGLEALMLPTLPTGWAYEGWVVFGDDVVSTGRFLDGMGADSDGAGPTAGPNAGPPRPGQDFIQPPRSLVGARVAITVEPEPDDAPTPFAIRPLLDETVENIAAPATQELANTSDVRPSGSVRIQ